MISARAALATLVGGVVVLVGSCAPLGISAYRSYFAEPISVTTLNPGITGRSDTVRVPPGKLAQVAIRADIQTASVQEVEESGRKEYKARYRFPATHTVTESGGRVLHSRSESVAWNEGSRLITGEKTGSTGGSLTAHHGFDKFAVPASGAIEVEARVEEDRTYGAQARKLELLVYGGLENVVPYVVAGVAMVIGGFVLAVLGMILLIVAAASSSAAATTAGPAAAATAEPEARARQRAALCHVAGFLGYLVPLGSVAAPLVAWLVWRDSDEFVNDQGREALNFQLSVLIYAVASAVLILVLIGIVLLVALCVFQLVFMVVAAVTASRGTRYRYPLTLRLVR